MTNHGTHNHPATPAARRACRAMMAALVTGTSVVLTDGQYGFVHNVYDAEYLVSFDGSKANAVWLPLTAADVASVVVTGDGVTQIMIDGTTVTRA